MIFFNSTVISLFNLKKKEIVGNLPDCKENAQVTRINGLQMSEVNLPRKSIVWLIDNQFKV